MPECPAGQVPIGNSQERRPIAYRNCSTRWKPPSAFRDDDREVVLVDDPVGADRAVRPGEGVLPDAHPIVAVTVFELGCGMRPRRMLGARWSRLPSAEYRTPRRRRVAGATPTLSLDVDSRPRAMAHVDGLLATDLVEVADLTADPGVLDGGGWWAVLATFEGAMTGYRFASVRPPSCPRRPRRGTVPDPATWRSSMDEAEYIDGVRRIRRYIEAGDVYQVNLCRVLSAPLRRAVGSAGAGPSAGRRQPGALPGRAPSGRSWIVTASPELFLSRDGDVGRHLADQGHHPTGGTLRGQGLSGEHHDHRPGPQRPGPDRPAGIGGGHRAVGAAGAPRAGAPGVHRHAPGWPTASAGRRSWPPPSRPARSPAPRKSARCR